MVKQHEKFWKKAYALNEFAFAPALGRFYANFRTFGQSLEIFEKYLKKISRSGDCCTDG